MDKTTKNIAIAGVIVVIVAIVSMNFEQITGKAIAKTQITASPRVIKAGNYINLEVIVPKGGSSKEISIYKENGVRQATFRSDCGGKWCSEKATLGKIATGSYKTSPTWKGRYYVAVEDYDTGEEVKAYFRVT